VTATTSPVLDLAFGSADPVDIPVHAGETNGVDEDPTGATVAVLLVIGRATPSPTDTGWAAAVWNVDASGRLPVYSVRHTFSGAVQGTTYALWVKIDAKMEFAGFVRWT
jgi:hypothetical protein